MAAKRTAGATKGAAAATNSPHHHGGALPERPPRQPPCALVPAWASGARPRSPVPCTRPPATARERRVVRDPPAACSWEHCCGPRRQSPTKRTPAATPRDAQSAPVAQPCAPDQDPRSQRANTSARTGPQPNEHRTPAPHESCPTPTEPPTTPNTAHHHSTPDQTPKPGHQPTSDATHHKTDWTQPSQQPPERSTLRPPKGKCPSTILNLTGYCAGSGVPWVLCRWIGGFTLPLLVGIESRTQWDAPRCSVVSPPFLVTSAVIAGRRAVREPARPGRRGGRPAS